MSPDGHTRVVGSGATAVALLNTDVLPRILAGAGLFVGLVGVALFVLLAAGAATDRITTVFRLVVVIAWLWTLPLCIALYRGGQSTVPEVEARTTESP